MAHHAVKFWLADGTWLTVPEADLGRIYTTLWQLSDLKGAISTAALLIDEARKQDRYRQPIELTPTQSDVLRQAVDRFADFDQSLSRDPTPTDAVFTMPTAVGERGILYWKREDGPDSARHVETARDVGTSWVIEADGTERPINGGDQITRAEAERLAAVGEYTFDPEP